MERQAHGKKFENAIRNFVGVEKQPYTAAFDMVYNNKEYSIKFIGEGNSVDCGSFKHIWKHCVNTVETGKSWYMILGRHISKICTAIYEVEFTPEICKQVMGALPTEEVYLICEVISPVYWEEGEHEEAREVAKQWKAEHKHLFGKISPTQKIDSKKQRRMQCTFGKTLMDSLFGDYEVQSKTFKGFVGVDYG